MADRSLRIAAIVVTAVAAGLSMPLHSFYQVAIPPYIRSLPLSGEEHAYFEALVQRSDYFKGYSLRPIAGRPKNRPDGKPDPYFANQLAGRSDGGYRNSSSGVGQITYDPASDAHIEAQDAAKAVVPVWTTAFTLKSDCLPGDTTVHLTSAPSLEKGIGLTVGNELMQVAQGESTHVADGSGGLRIPVLRGLRDTSTALHQAGATIRRNNNSLFPGSQLRVPVGTRDGHSYLITADFYFTAVFVGRPFDYYKFYQLSSGPSDDKIWFELQTRFFPSRAYQPSSYDSSRDVGVATARYYGGFAGSADWMVSNGDASGSYARKAFGITKQDPIVPMANGSSDGGFVLKPRTWTRVWWLYEQRLNDWDIVSMWIADEHQEAQLIYRGVQVSVGNPGTIEKFWIEMNTSQQEFTGKFTSTPGDSPEMVMYHRNIVVLEDPPTIGGLLVRPGPGRLPRAGAGPLPPLNLRSVP